MIKTIGKVQLDVTKYSGRDLSANAAVEDEILKIVQNNAQEEYTEAIESGLSWPVVYHLSPLRRNIVDWIPMDKSMKVLEVGSDCGALTGSLCRKAGVVTCVESSKRRSIINATRNRSYDNLTIHVGNMKEIEPALPTDYDYIFLMRPGLTSMATIHNGYTDTMEKMLIRLEMDLDYLKNRSLWLDAKLIFTTVFYIVNGKKF